MKNWLSIGQFAKTCGISPRALRVYEEFGLIEAHTRGENGYRYYTAEQSEQIALILQFKSLGFSLAEIKNLKDAGLTTHSEGLRDFLNQKLVLVCEQERDLFNQKSHIKHILSSLQRNKGGLGPSERRYIMSHFEKISIVVTGIKKLELTGLLIQKKLAQAGQEASVVQWNPDSPPPLVKPYILLIEEEDLKSADFPELSPDVVVIKEISAFETEIEQAYLKLYGAVGPHMATILNADDGLSVALAANEALKRGKIFYYSKNSALTSQIQKIGGVVSDGEQVSIYGLNQGPGSFSLKFNRPLGLDEEGSSLAAFAAVLDIGISEEKLKESPFAH